MRTSAIEGEVLDRASVQSSLRRQFGLSADGAPSRPREQGVAEMMVDVYSTYAAPLTHETLSRWHGMLLAHDRGLETSVPTGGIPMRCRSSLVASPADGAFRSAALRAGPRRDGRVRRLVQPNGARTVQCPCRL